MKEQIAEYVIPLFKDIPMAVYGGLLSILCLGVVGIIVCYGLKRGWKGIVCLLLVEYIFLIFSSTVIYRNGYEGAGYELSPFWSYTAIREGRKELLVEIIMNVVAFIPVGMLLGSLFRVKGSWMIVTIIGCSISISLEAMQFFFHRGFAEVDDVLHNTAGGMIGWLMVKGVLLVQNSRLRVHGGENG